MKSRCCFFCFSVLVFFISFLKAPILSHSKETLIIAGTGSALGVMRIIAEDFQRQYPGVAVIILPSIGSTGSIMAVKKNKIDIGLSIRRLKPEEKNREIVEEPYGQTAVVFGAQESNPVKGLTLSEIEDIYSGKRNAWPDGTPLRLILRPRSETLSEYLEDISPDLKLASEISRSISGVFVGITDQDAADQIEKTPGAFGITTSTLISSEKRKIKLLFIDNMAPTLANVSAGTYPYTITHSMVYKQDKYKGTLKSFLGFIFSENGSKILLKNNLVPFQRDGER